MILGIETSCDESALALFDPEAGLAGEWVHTQIALHADYGGVVPDLASREHLRNLPILLEQARADRPVELAEQLTAVAVTTGPGLAGCLALGVAMAKSLGLAWRVPVVGVNHLRAHAYSPFIPVHARDPGGFEAGWPQWLPHLGLLVSGGNTVLFALEAEGRLTTLAETADDAAGEALDKGAKLLGLGYPGGPQVEARARGGNPERFPFPRAREFLVEGQPGFSFSGVKTSLRYFLEARPGGSLEADLPDICASYQSAVIGQLVEKTEKWLQRGPAGGGKWGSLGLSGGVANNAGLRQACAKMAGRAGLPFLPALARHTGDNAAMVAFAAWREREAGGPGDGLDLAIAPSLRLEARAGT